MEDKKFLLPKPQPRMVQSSSFSNINCFNGQPAVAPVNSLQFIPPAINIAKRSSNATRFETYSMAAAAMAAAVYNQRQQARKFSPFFAYSSSAVFIVLSQKIKEDGQRKKMAKEAKEEQRRCKQNSTRKSKDASRRHPAAVVPGQKGIDELDYYHGLLPREDVNAMLHKDGEFLVRNTELVQGTAVRQMCLSVKALGTVRHFPLQANEAGLYTIDGQPQFPTMLGLINHYYTTRTPFTKNKVKLLSPVVRHDGNCFTTKSSYDAKSPTDKPRPVAVKTMKCSYQTKAKIEELMKEARLMRELDHPHIVRCFGVAAEIAAAANGVACFLGFEYVHSKGIIHCDIACRNCLYGDGELKLSDFGMSRKTEKHELATNDLTPVRWTAPEVSRKKSIPFAKATDWAPEKRMLADEMFSSIQKNRIRMPEVLKEMEQYMPNVSASSYTSYLQIISKNKPQPTIFRIIITKVSILCGRKTGTVGSNTVNKQPPVGRRTETGIHTATAGEVTAEETAVKKPSQMRRREESENNPV
uniref:Tyrosine-protein kinase n=1 Tax=Ditylenchus dipsaci TaxID=166011 RepID=A0A915EV83_9BILA